MIDIWSHTYLCGIERTLSREATARTPHWCDVCSLYHNKPCHAHSGCPECARGFARLSELVAARRTVAALFVHERGSYAGLPHVELWSESRDARLYAGPWPVIAHPPCERWCRLAHAVQGRYPHLRVGDDGGCFASALAAVRRRGGVLEHPAHSKAWRAYDLPNPPLGGWQRTICGGWVAEVYQARYGHRAAKATWLYAVSDSPLPALRWGPPVQGTHVVGFCTNRSRTLKPRLSSRDASHTPDEFRDVLLAIARAAKGDV